MKRFFVLILVTGVFLMQCSNGSQQQTATTYAITVMDGTAKNSAGTVVTSAVAGDTITIVANSYANGKIFDKWMTSAKGVRFENEEAGTTIFTMPTSAVSVTATYNVFVSAKNFGGATAITGSEVFIENRSLSISAIYASDHEVTQKEYETYCKYGGSAPWAKIGLGDNFPAYNVSWYDAVVYCNLKSLADSLTPCYKLDSSIDTKNWADIVSEDGEYCGPSSNNETWNGITCDWTSNGWRLPTEAEWEFLARGGNLSTSDGQTTYSGSDIAEIVGWCTGSKSHEVKGKTANGLNLYDMSGNVWEWCWDFYNTIEFNTAKTGPSVALYDSDRTRRGGGFSSGDYFCTVAYRDYIPPYNRNGSTGFRVVRNAQ